MLITKESQPGTLINVFETRPEQQQALIENWIRFADSVKGETGFDRDRAAPQYGRQAINQRA